MKILFVINDLGSFNNFLIEFAKKLKDEQGHEIYLFCSKARVINIPLKYNLDFIDGIYYTDIPRSFDITKIIISGLRYYTCTRRLKPDLVLSHFSSAIFVSVLFSNNTTNWGTFHGLGYPLEKGLMRHLRYFAEIFSMFRLNRILFLNNSDYQIQNNNIKKKSTVIKTMGLGCDISKFKPIFHKPAVLAHGFHNDLTLGFIGRFVDFKGFHLVCKAYLNLRKLRTKLKLILVGDFDRLHNSGLSKYEYEILKQDPNVLITGFTNDVRDFITRIHLHIYPSRREGVPISVIETMSMGVPNICLAARGAVDLIDNGVNGILVENLSDDNKVIELITDYISALDFQTYSRLCSTLLSQRDRFSRENFMNFMVNEIEN